MGDVVENVYPIEDFPNNKFYAKVEQGVTTQDYYPLQDCVRLIAVSPDSFQRSAFNLECGCSTYILDIGRSDLGGSGLSHRRKRYPSLSPLPLPRSFWVDDCYFEDDSSTSWWEVSYTISAIATGSYAYLAFTPSEPKYLNISSVRRVSGPVVDPVPLSDEVSLPLELEFATDKPFKLTAFHVGQGMCSLFSNEKLGYLLDAGAGTPITRDVYRKNLHRTGVPFVNDLSAIISGHEQISAIISHADSDHWRILEWDEGLLEITSTVYLPAGRPALAFSSPLVKGKVVGIRDKLISFGPHDRLEVYRSDPSVSDKNGDSLVVVVNCQQKQALYPGDYVYDRMAVDGNLSIATLAEARFDAVVVPHHGDEASAWVMPWPKVPDESQAFFSAGTHAGYGHPTNASLSAHERKGFVNIDKHTCSHIRAHHLLP
ncbi:hypothetical protein [Pseudomonas aeruginosa]|uniref:hypothetical protein n=1 Tax=Pseudomonas aeruginosa TaxID=287 RepID=UPI001495EBCA|nr:hypothetical protein [Pseudomonas aeruginosa]MBI8085587.1 hypothetical protein [Pseudomonas aeruginosa]